MNTSRSAEPRSRQPIRVLCVDDSRDITSILGRCINDQPDMESAGCLHSADDLASEVKERHPDVVLLDMKMPGRDPLEALREVSGGAARVIVFSGRDDQDAVDLAIEAGARGFLAKDATVPVMLEAIREVARGTVPFGVWR